MDVNGTPLHLVTGRADWERVLAASDGFEWDAEFEGVRLADVTRRFEQPGAARLALEDLRGADCDGYGHVYWIDEDRRSIRIRARGATDAATYWSVAALEPEPPGADAGLFGPVAPGAPRYAALRLSGLAVTTRHFLVVGTLEPGGLLVFDLHAGGLPRLSAWPEALDFRPFALAAEPTGGVWLLDRGGAGSEARVWRLDADLRHPDAGWTRAPAESQPEVCEGPPPPDCARFGGVPAGEALGALEPHAIVGLSATSYLLLDTEPGASHSRVVYVGGGQPRTFALDATLLGETLAPPAEILGHALAVIPRPASMPGRLLATVVVVGRDGNQAYAFRLEAAEGSDVASEPAAAKLEPEPGFWPLRDFGGKALVHQGERVLYDIGERWVPMAPHPRRRFVEGGTLRGIVLDGGLPGCVWHRLLLDACLPDGVGLVVRARSADRLEDLPRQPFAPPEPKLYRRREGSELAFHEPFPDARGADAGTWETLFQEATGRWLELCLEVRGGGRHTPKLRALRVYAPRFSYLREYLPDVYQADRTSAAFLERYLANVEGLFTSLESRIAAAEGCFDPRIASAEFVAWLGGWFANEFAADFADERRRIFLDYAEVLYRWRGTVPGLVAMLTLTTDRCVDLELLEGLKSGGPFGEERAGFRTRIVERYLVRVFGGLPLGDPSGALTLPVVDESAAWNPADGAEPLHADWRTFLAARRGTAVPESTTLSPVLPSDADAAAEWRAFMATRPFAYAPVTAADAGFYRLFLAQRYLTVDKLNAAYGLTGAAAYVDFASIALPAEDDFPAAGARLVDWMRFASLALPIRADAYRFTVLVPTTPDETDAERRTRLDRIAAVVEREKPAHTVFDVQPFWALFQVGTVRLGLDTQLGEGARYTAIQLGVTGTGEGTLAYGHPWNVTDRAVAGRDRVAEMTL